MLPGASRSRPASLPVLLAVTFLGSVSGGAFWAGIFFVTAEHYRFSPVRNLLLAGAMGATYALAARLTGDITRALERVLAPRTVLGGTLLSWGLVSLAPLACPDAEWILWMTAIVGAAASAMTWPIVEAYLAAGRHGAQMRSALGWFNVIWTPATAAPLLIMPLVARIDVLWTIALSAIANVAAVVGLAGFPARPGAHERAAAEAAVGREYPWLLRSVSWLLPLSYVLSSTLSPVLPHRLAAMPPSALPHSVIAAMWMVARFATLGLMWRLGFWHGRWGTLAAAAFALAGGLSATLLASSVAMVIAGLLLFGVGMGLTYYCAIYYSLAVGHAAVDAGGNFEALIGLGYCIGPLLGLTGHITRGDSGASSATVLLAFVATALASALAIRPYREARRRRRTDGTVGTSY